MTKDKSKSKNKPKDKKPADKDVDKETPELETYVDGRLGEDEVGFDANVKVPADGDRLDVECLIPFSIPESQPELPLPKIHLRVFEKIAGPKWDQMAGFQHYAKSQKLGPMTIPEWHEALLVFKQKPTK